VLKNRVIPALLLQSGGLVKTRKFRDPVYVGDPVNAIRIFNEKEVDELMVLDIRASREGLEPNFALIEKFAGECFMPLTYGGGVRTLEQAGRLFALGVEKISVQTSALENLSIVREVSDKFGSQSIVVSVDVERGFFGSPRLRKCASGKTADVPWLEFAQRAVAAGAGEILLNAVHKDGTLSGPDLPLVTQASRALSVPLIALGGVASLDDIRKCVDAGASAVAAGAFFVYHGPYRAVLITYPAFADLESVLGNKNA
jgi:cyclase